MGKVETHDKLSNDLEAHLLTDSSTDDTLESLDFTDIDEAVFDFVNDKLNLHAEFQGELKKVKVIFAIGERWAVVRDNLRDEKGTLILPAISIRRISESRAHEESLPASSPALNSIVYKVKRSPKNVHYQNLKNDIGLRNQTNVGVNIGTNSDAPAGKTSRRIAAKAFSGTVFRGRKLAAKEQPEILDIFSVPFPDFFKFEYEITLWTQYISVMNSLKQKLANNFESFSIDTYKIDTKKGYWFVAYIDPSVENQENFDDLSDTERIIKQTIKLSIPAYSIQAQPGDTNLIRKFTSTPEISFSVISLDTLPDVAELRLRNPLDKKRLTDVENDIEVDTRRPRVQRIRSSELLKKISKKKVSESSFVFINTDELLRFFK